MNITLVICTRNRAARLRQTLETLASGDIAAEGAELVLVDSASNDGTPGVIADFARRAPFAVRPCRVELPGVSRARNEGIRHARGDLVAFNDDDCLVDPDYFRALKNSFDPREAQYGCGEIYLSNRSGKGGGYLHISKRGIIAPSTLLHAGAMQGGNLFVLRSVFEKVGTFNEDMGIGTPFPCEDIEFATRCSFAGFTGIHLPNVRVCHDHARPTGSEEAEGTLRGYDHGRGAYYASLIARGIDGAWMLWSRCTPRQTTPLPKVVLERLANEMEAGSKYLRLLAARD
jgi:glycosyltransferase involved in cell wall biosynthesis